MSNLIVPQNYDFGKQLIGLYEAMAEFGATAGATSFFRPYGSGDLQRNYGVSYTGAVRAFTDSGLFSYARLMTLAGYNYDQLAAGAGTLNLIQKNMPLLGNPDIDTHGDAYGNSTRGVANMTQGYQFEKQIVDQNPSTFRPNASQKLDFSDFFGPIDYDDGNLKGTPIQVLGFGSIIGTKNADNFKINDSKDGKNEVTRFYGGGGGDNGQDTFDVDYGAGGVNPLLLQNDGNSTFKFENAQNASFTVAWGGTAGGNTFDIETGTDGTSSTGTMPSVNICIVKLDGIDEKSCANLDLNALKKYVVDKYTSDYTRNIDSSIVIINPTSSDKIEFNGQLVTNPKSSLSSISTTFLESSAVDGEPNFTSGIVSKDGDGKGPSGTPQLAGFEGQFHGLVSGYWTDSVETRQSYAWRSGNVSLHETSSISNHSDRFRNVSIGYDAGQVARASTTAEGYQPFVTTMTDAAGFDPSLDVKPGDHTGDVFTSTPNGSSQVTYSETFGGMITGKSALSRVTQGMKTISALNLLGFNQSDFGLTLNPAVNASKNVVTDTKTTFSIGKWNQWKHMASDLASIGDRLSHTVSGIAPDLSNATQIAQEITTNTVPSATDSGDYDRQHGSVRNLQLAADDSTPGSDNGGGSSGGGGGSPDNGNQTITSDGAATTLAGAATATLQGNDDSVTASGTGGTVNVAGLRATATISGGTVNLWTGATGTITGNNDTVVLNANGTASVRGTGNTVNVAAAGNTVAASAANVMLSTGAAAVVAGDGNTVGLNANGVAAVTGSGNTINVAAAGNTVVTNSATVNLWDGAGASLFGQSNVVTLNARGSLTVSGSGNRVAVNAVGNTVSITGSEIDLWNNSGATVSGDGNTILAFDNVAVTASGANTTLMMNGSGESVSLSGTNGHITVAGTASTLAASAAAVTLKDGATLTATGNSNSYTLGKSAVLNAASGTGQVVKVAGTGALVALASSEVDLTDNTDAQVWGNGNVYTLASNDTLTVTGDNTYVSLNGANDKATVNGSTVAVSVAGTGHGLTASSAFVALQNGARLTAGGSSDTFTLAANTGLDASSGTGHVVTVAGTNVQIAAAASQISLQAGAGAQVTGNGDRFTLASNASLVASGNNSTVTIAGANDAATVTGTGTTVDISGTGHGVSVSSAAITLRDAARVTVQGRSNRFSLGQNTGLDASSGSANVVSVTGANAQVAVTASEVDLQAHSTAQVSGNTNTFSFEGTASLAVSGTGEAFVFKPTSGSAMIAGYDASDTVQFSRSTFASWTDLISHAAQSGANTVIHTTATDTVTLQNVTLATLDKSHFQFV